MSPLQTITLKQVLATMQASPDPFSIRYVKLNEQKGTGGEIVEVGGQHLSGRRVELGRASTGRPAAKATEATTEPTARGRNPNHYENLTRNLVSSINGHYSKVHIYLILQFNGKKVIL